MYLILGFVPDHVNEPEGMVVANLQYLFKNCHPEARQYRARNLLFATRNRFLTDKPARNDSGQECIHQTALLLGYSPDSLAAAPDVRLAFMKSGDEAGSDSKGTLAPGLYLVATPIGNLEDITLRAVRVLKQADLIACEDTRQTQKLLNHYGITTRTSSYHEHNEMTRSAELVLDLEGGARVALVTDAGMPGISDPGFRLISLAIRHHIPVVPIPGASAFLAALVASGLPTDSFRFSGFLPSKSGQRRQMLESIKASPRTQVFYEAPHRVKEAVEDVVEILGEERHVVIAREVTKIHEEFLRGRASEILEALNARGDIKGEITLLIGKAEETERKAATGVSMRQRLQQIMTDEKLDEKAALKRIAKEMGVSKSEAYRELQRSK